MRERKKTKFTGVYEQISPERRFHGKPDSCFYITYKANGKLVWEKVGWRSESFDAFSAKTVRDAKLAKERLGLDPRNIDLRLVDAWEEYYERVVKNKTSVKSLEGLWRNYINPHLGNERLEKIKPVMLGGLVKELEEKGKAPQTIKHALVLIKSLFRYMIRVERYTGPIPIFTMPQVDSQRLRYLTPEEVSALLIEMDRRSPKWGDICRLSLMAGLRLREIFGIQIRHIDFVAGVLHIMDAKAGTRIAYISPALKDILKKYMAGKTSDIYIFTQENGEKINHISQIFVRVVKCLKFNEGIEDRRHKVVFHTLRHTFASWLAMKGTPLYVIAELMGHKTLEMTNRYKHLCPDQKQSAVAALGEFL